MTRTINIAKDFSETPLGRYPSDNDFSGERFRDELLVPALQNADEVIVKIDGVEGYGSSFLEEAFGGLVRRRHFSPGALRAKMRVKFDDPDFQIYADQIWEYIDEARCEAK